MFAVNIDSKQYGITAKHVIKDFQNGDSIALFFENTWHYIPAKIIYHPDNSYDVIALSLPIKLITELDETVEASSKGLFVGADAVFAGFPNNWYIPNSTGYPNAFVKRCLISAMESGKWEEPIRFYIDTMVNKGFSGSPLFFNDCFEGKTKIGGIVTGFKLDSAGIIDKFSSEEAGYQAVVQSGISIAYSIDPIIFEIKRNPIGLDI